VAPSALRPRRGTDQLIRPLTIILIGVVISATISCTRQKRDTLDADLLQAARKGDTASVERLLKKGANIEAKDQGDWTALAVAANYGHADTVKLLLENGADPVAGQLDGDKALFDAA
jgi:uncharacterized protein